VEAFMHDAAQDMRIARDQLVEALDGLADRDWARYVPYGSRTVHDVLAHLAGADHVWALAAQGLLKGEADARPPLTAQEAAAARTRAIERGRALPPRELRGEMERRRNLLLGLYELLEKRHLAMRLPTFGDAHNSVRERIWLGYHDRLHRADIERALRMTWRPPGLTFPQAARPAAAALSPDETLYVINSVDPSYWERPARGLGWTYRQLLAHIATGDWVLQGHLRHIIETGAVGAWPDIEDGNAQRLQERRSLNDRTLTEEYLSMRHETLRLISQLKREHLELEIELPFRPKGEHPHTVLGYVLGFDAHDRAHRDQLRPAMKHATSTR
jgi:uncharacterized damage-inducible protein DinB